MSFSFASLFATAEAAFSAFQSVAGPLESLASTAAPVVEALVPSSVPVISGIEAGAASIAAVAPNALTDAKLAISVGKQIVSDGGPLLSKLESICDSIFHVSTAPGGVVVLTPKTTAATVPAAPPAGALS